MDTLNSIDSEAQMLAYLTNSAIPFTRIEHPAVFTCEEARPYRPEVPGLETKNLFLRDERRRFYLVVTDCAKRLDLKALGAACGAPKLHFGTEAELRECLGLTPGSVTILGLVNDPRGKVELLVDRQYWPAEAYLCHPLVNTATLVISHSAMERFLALNGHSPRVVDIPARP